MLEHTFSDFGIRYSLANLSGRHLNLRCNEIIIFLRYFMKVLNDSGMFIFLEFRLGCLSSPYQKYLGVCSFSSVYTFFSEVFIANPPCVCIKIHTVGP